MTCMRLTRRASHLASERAHVDSSACRGSARHGISWRSWRAAPRWPRALRVLVLCVLTIPLMCLSPLLSAAESQRSAIGQPASSPSMGSNSMARQSGHGSVIGQQSPLVQAQPILGEHPVFTRITTDQGLSDLQVPAIVQDHAGFIWFGTTNGLNRYDGYNIVTYRNDSENPYSLSGNFIEALYEDRSGTLWVGTRSGLNAFDRRTERFTRYLHDPADSRSLSNSAPILLTSA